jgi:hypothetical protein
MSSLDSFDTRKNVTSESLSSPSSLQMKITDFPFSKVGFGRKVSVIGVGSAGCRAISQISRECRMLEHFLYVSSDEHDIATINNGKKLLIGQTAMKGERSPYSIRGSVHSKDLIKIKQHASDSEVLIIVSGLGGAVGSALSPLIAKEISESQEQTKIIAVLIMPHAFEVQKHFYAGCAFGQISRVAFGIVLIDNDDLWLSSSSPVELQVSLLDSHATVNQRLALILNNLMASASTEEKEKKPEIDHQDITNSIHSLINYFSKNPYSLVKLNDGKVNAKLEGDALFKNKSFSGEEILASSVEKGSLLQTIGYSPSQKRDAIEFPSLSVSNQLMPLKSLSETKFAKYDPLAGSRITNLEEETGMQEGSKRICLELVTGAIDQLIGLEDIEAICSK